MFHFPWGLFAVLVGTLLPFSVLVRSSGQLVHDRRLGLSHTLNIYRLIRGVLVIPFLAIIGPAGFYLLFGYGDPELAARVVRFLGTLRGFVTTSSLLVGVMLIDIFGPRMAEQLSRIPISDLRRTPLQFRKDTAVVGVIFLLAALTALFVPN